MLKPDYNNNIVNLMASIAQTMGSLSTPYQPLEWLPAEALGGGPLVLLIIDGLGDDYLGGHPDSFLLRHRKGRLSAVFPSTTSTAITSFFTAVAPQQHAITGWYTWFRELGCVTTVLPFHPRSGTSFDNSAITPDRLIGHGSLFDELTGENHVINPDYIVDSAYSLAISGKAQRHGYGSLEEMAALVQQLAVDGNRKLIIAYWSQLDGLAHIHGMDSAVIANHFAELDNTIEALSTTLKQSDARLLVTADHGLVDTDAEHTIQLEHHPELAACLALPLCGEPRTAFCYLRPGKEKTFEDYVSNELGHACQAVCSEHLIDMGYFGLGDPHPQLKYRVGDYALLMKENYVIKDRLLAEKPFTQTGVHGGLSSEELYVPLITC